ncbi:helix-turn-helix domain-containing protein [Parabacteroides sp.]
MRNFDNVLLMLLSPSESVLLLILMERAGDDGKPIVVSYPQLSKLSNVAITSVGKHIQILKCFGFIKVDIDDRTNGNSYIIRWDVINRVVEKLNMLCDMDSRIIECKRIRKKALSKKNEVT